MLKCGLYLKKSMLLAICTTTAFLGVPPQSSYTGGVPGGGAGGRRGEVGQDAERRQGDEAEDQQVQAALARDAGDEGQVYLGVLPQPH